METVQSPVGYWRMYQQTVQSTTIMTGDWRLCRSLLLVLGTKQREVISKQDYLDKINGLERHFTEYQETVWELGMLYKAQFANVLSKLFGGFGHSTHIRRNLRGWAPRLIYTS